MEHGLPAMAVAVDHATVTIVGEAPILGPAHCSREEFFHERAVIRLKIIERRDPTLRNEQHVHGRLRIDVAERQQFIVFVNDIGRNFTSDDPVEDRVGHCGSLQLGKVFSFH
jgi:hypothetical protein